MNRNEITKLLEILVTNYGKKVTDPKTMADSWEMILGSYSAEAVFKAARLHMVESKYFPNPADIRERIPKAQLVYNSPMLPALGTGEDDAKKWEPFIDAFAEMMGFGCEPNEDIDLRDYLPEGEKMPPFLLYEL